MAKSSYFKSVTCESKHRKKNKRKSGITVVEVNSEARVDRHNKKGDTGKDQIL